jgi:type I restriction enzyme R subunit
LDRHEIGAWVAFTARFAMSKQALDSEKVRSGLKDVLLGPAQLYEVLKAKGDGISPQTP